MSYVTAGIEEQHIGWRQSRRKFEDTIKQWCWLNDCDFYGTYTDIQIPIKNKAVKLCVFELMDNFNDLKILDRQCQQQNKKIYYFTDNLVDLVDLKNIKIVPIHELFGLVENFDIVRPQTPNKLYNCFMHRVDPVRQSWFYFLKHHNQLDNGYVSFLLYQKKDSFDNVYTTLNGIELYDYIHKNHQLDV